MGGAAGVGAVVLEGHVFNLERQKFAVFLHLVEDVAGLLRVDVDLDDASVPEADHGFPHAVEIILDPAQVKGLGISHLCPLQPEQELGAVAEDQLAVFGEAGKVRAGGLAVRGGGPRRGGLAVQGSLHALGDAEEARAAAVHHAGLPQHVQQLRRPVQGPAQLPEKIGAVAVCRAGFVQPGAGVGHGVLVDREDRPLHRDRDGPVGLIHAVGQGPVDGGEIGGLHVLQGVGDAGEDPGENDAGIPPGAQEHALGRRGRDFSETVAPGGGQLRRAGVDGHIHIVSGIPVGDRKHVEIVDALSVGGKIGRAGAKHGCKHRPAEHLGLHAGIPSFLEHPDAGSRPDDVIFHIIS